MVLFLVLRFCSTSTRSVIVAFRKFRRSYWLMMPLNRWDFFPFVFVLLLNLNWLSSILLWIKTYSLSLYRWAWMLSFGVSFNFDADHVVMCVRVCVWFFWYESFLQFFFLNFRFVFFGFLLTHVVCTPHTDDDIIHPIYGLDKKTIKQVASEFARCDKRIRT